MKLNDLIEALAGEIELVEPQLDESLDRLSALEFEDTAFMDALDQYSGQAQRMGEAAEMAGFPGLQTVCSHVLENTLLLASFSPSERGPVITFLRAWPPLMVHYLKHIDDPSCAAGLVDHLRNAPSPMEEDLALKTMHQLGAMPLQVGLPGGEGDVHSSRPVLATAEDVALIIPEDVDQKLMEGFRQEAPGQALYLVDLTRNMASGQGDSSDVVAAKRVAHTLKGSGAIIGLRGLTTLGHHLEDILENYEHQGGHVAKPAADAMLDAAYCLEQMVGYVTGSDDYPEQAQAVLQTVLDLANRIDRGETIEQPMARPAATMPHPDSPGKPGITLEIEPDQPRPAVPAHTQVIAPSATLRVSLQRFDQLFRVSGEVSVHTAAMETRIKVLANRAKELLEQNLRVQKRLFELETLVDVRALTMMRARSRGTSEAVAFDPLEMDQYSELHSTTHALVEEASDARVMALNVEEAVAQLSSLQNRQQVLARDLQHLVVGTRMSEVGAMESRLQRNVRTTCQTTGKQATLELRGGDTLIDSDVLSRLADPLLHLLRNAVDHGIEAPAERIAAGKPEAGRILLEFSQQGQQIAMRCTDDGRGLDYLSIQRRAVERGLMTPGQSLSMDEIARFVLMPGFSTRDAVSEVSGRGVGLDVVRDWVASMNGSVRIGSKQGQGCTIELRFSASLSTIHSLIVETGGQRFALPAIQVEQAVPRGMGNIEQMGDRLIFHYQKRALPATRLAEIVGLPVDLNVPLENYDFVIVKHGDGIQALAVDQLLDARDLLVNNPGRYARHVRGVAGLSILGDGSVAVNLDLTQLVAGNLRRTTVVAAGDQSRPRTQTTQITLPGVLIVDDALTVRNSLQQLLEDSGFRAATARDGIDAINTLADFHADIVLTDLEMPNMNGVELTTHIRGRDDLKNLPVIMITSRSQDKHRQLAEKAGVNAYITKPYNEGDLLNTIRQSIAA